MSIARKSRSVLGFAMAAGLGTVLCSSAAAARRFADSIDRIVVARSAIMIGLSVSSQSHLYAGQFDAGLDDSAGCRVAGIKPMFGGLYSFERILSVESQRLGVNRRASTRCRGHPAYLTCRASLIE